MGLYTVVLDPYSHSPAKRYASKSYNIDVKDLNAVDRVICEESVTGVLVGVADPLVPYYQKICARNKLHCYATEILVQALTSKTNFAKTCVNHGVPIIPFFDVDANCPDSINRLDYPVVVKPVDAGAGVGISLCRTPSEFRSGVDNALASSIRKEVLVEKFMQCDDMFAYYTFVDGVAHLSALADRYKTDKQGQLSSVCIAAEYPSCYANRFKRDVHPKLVRMFEDLGMMHGVLLIQFFVDEKAFYAYDPGFRLQGEAPHLYLKHFNHFDQREMLLRFAMSGEIWSGDFNDVNDSDFKGRSATTVWVLLKAGRISFIQGLEAIRLHRNVIEVLQRFNTGDQITPDMMGTERQVFARIYTIAETPVEAAEVIEYIHNTLVVVDESGADMILDRYQKEIQR